MTTNFSSLVEKADRVLCDPAGDIPPQIVEDALTSESRPDIVTPFRQGKEWLFEQTARFQPRSASILLTGRGPCIVYRRHDDTYLTNLVMEIDGYVVEVCRAFWGSNPDDPGYQERIARIGEKLTKQWGRPMQAEERHLSLPEPIRMAYYHRFDGLNIPDSLSFGIYTRLLPFPIWRPWESIDGYLRSAGLGKSLLPLVEDMIPGIRPVRKDWPYNKFMMFLDSRPTLRGREGDALFVKNHIQDGVIYCVRDADVANMTILADPAEAIDRYCEHVLLRREGRFDFRPYAVPFVSP